MEMVKLLLKAAAAMLGFGVMGHVAQRSAANATEFLGGAFVYAVRKIGSAIKGIFSGIFGGNTEYCEEEYEMA